MSPRHKLFRRSLAGLTGLAFAVVVGAPAAGAHPLGNLTSNTSTSIVVGRDEVVVEYVVDLAELPTVQERQTIDTDSDGSVSPAEAGVARDSSCRAFAAGLRLTADGRPIELMVETASLAFPEGQAGLLTTRFECRLGGPVDTRGNQTFVFDDENLADRIGWREVIAVGDGTTLAGDVPSTSSSALLTAYPTDVTPPRVLHAEFRSTPGGMTSAVDTPVPSSSQPRGADGLTERFQRLVGSRDLTLGLALVTIALAFVLGAAHALAPGHGKTLMAAAVVSRRGTTRQILGIGATVTLTHTAGVLVLGSLIWFSDVLAPDDAVPWLTVASGLLIAALGFTLLVRRVVLGHAGHGHHHVTGLAHHAHDEHLAGHDYHAHDHHAHEHHGHDHHEDAPGHHHGHGHDRSSHHAPALTRRWIVSMGIAGGLVPTPSALVVLLGATALGRTWLGVVLVGVYGIGMATTLLAAGLLLVRLQSWLERNWFDRAWLRLGMRVAPVATAAVLVVGGISIMVRGAAGV